jgi:transposase
MLVLDQFKCDPRSGHVFVFFNRSHDKAKILYWDRNGYVLHYKRLEKHRYVLPKSGQVHYQINEMQLAGLLAGLNFEIIGEFYEINYENLF